MVPWPSSQATSLGRHRTLEPYECLLEYMRTEGALDFCYYEPFLQEWEQLQLVDGMKADHLPNASKDVAGAVARAVFNASRWFTGEGEVGFV